MSFKTTDATYPDNFTNESWQINKKYAGKKPVVSKTGLGPVLVKAQAAWKAINFDHLDVARAGVHSLPDALAAKTRAEALRKGPVAKAVTALKAASQKAATTSQDKLLHKDSQRYAASIVTGLNRRVAALEALELDDFDAEIKRQAVAQLVPLAHKIDADLNAFFGDPSPKPWDDIRTGVGAMNTALQAMAKLPGMQAYTNLSQKWVRANTLATQAKPFEDGATGGEAKRRAAGVTDAVRLAVQDVLRL